MIRREVLFLGGNGHAPARLQLARDALAAAGASLELVDVDVPGFFGRERAHSFDEMLAAIEGQIGRAPSGAPCTPPASAAFARAARARHAAACCRRRCSGPGAALDAAPDAAAPRRRASLFGVGAFSGARAPCRLPWSDPVRAPFFEGYARCAAFADLFRWASPAGCASWKGAAQERRAADISVVGRP
jgi:hypothetical protein